MRMPWFRVYGELLSDPKIKRIARSIGCSKSTVIGIWISMLAIAGDSDDRGKLLISGQIPYTTEDLVDELDLEPSELAKFINQFRKLGMIEGDETITIVNWEKRQPSSDNSAERVKRYRQNKEEKKETLHDRYIPVTVTELERSCNALDSDKDKDTDTDSDTESEEEADLIPAAPEFPPETRFLHQFLDILSVQFTKNEQAQELHELYETYGPELLLEVAAWAAEKVPRNMGHALSMVRSAAATWQIKKDPPPREKTFAQRLAEA